MSRAQTHSFSVVDVHVVIRSGNRVLLGLRKNTGYMDGMYHLPSGHLEPDESVTGAAIREAREELGLVLQEQDLTLVHVVHQCSGGASRVGLFFSTSSPAMASNLEPEKCETLGWFRADALPDNVVPYAKTAIERIVQGVTLSENGWELERTAA